jgi:hypothetical protein
MSDFDPNAFLGEEAAPQAAAPQATPPPKGLEFDPEAFVNDGQAIDPYTDEKIPLTFSGRTPETAINKSPLSAMDRLSMAFGNPAGNIKYLTDKFGKDHVKPITDSEGKPTSDLAVYDGKSWNRVDPINGEIADPWKLTTEYAKDLNELQKQLQSERQAI